MPTAATTGPLQNDRESRIGLCDVDDLLDSVERAGLESDVLEAKRLDVFVGDLERRDTGTDGQTLDWDTLGAEILDERNLPRHRAWVDVDAVDGDARSRGRPSF